MRPPHFQGSEIRVSNRDDRIEIDAAKYRASIVKRGYVSGVMAGSFEDKSSGARDLGFGLDIVDFLLEPADPTAPIPKDQYDFGPTNKFHGNIPKRYVEGPQICTQAKHLEPKIVTGKGFVAVTQKYTWNVAYAPREKAGSVWEQTLIFLENERFFLAADRVTVANASPGMTLRVDLPGHIKHDDGKGFEHVYLSYIDEPFIPSTEFVQDFPPDGRFLYTRGKEALPKRFIRAYQTDLGPAKGDGPWLAGMTLNPEDVSQAWCHQRGYVCMIQEIGGREVKPGDTFGAAYIIGWFDDLEAMNATYDRFRGYSGFALGGEVGYRGVKAGELTAIGV
jgi:hypothetical protein